MLRRFIELGLLVLAGSVARAQSPRLHLSRPEPAVAHTSVPTAIMSGILSEGHRRELLHGGWPTAISARVELWRRGALGAFDRESAFEWDVIVEYSPASKVYHLRRVINNRVDDLGETASIEAAEQNLRRPYSPPLSPQRRGETYFYSFEVEISTLSMSDLEAWQRWVRGEATPAIRGKRNPVGVFQRGLGSLLSRVLGGDRQTYRTQTTRFSAG